ncbi:MAG: Gfo/Idh/MocA family oxidoreductase [Muribaculaceae bacterium]|nr:Gfo/Idh/MocA family oxidoreductase [Muribaculaceae bacterium]MBR1727659.1 Gfo/Idh/MocA family oxidoreductase [Muribaculaceae bacterium]
MKKVITYGTYDLLHYGHIRLLERAKALGDYLIVGVTADNFDLARGKINVQQSLMERIDAVRETGLADEIIVEEYEGQKIDDIRRMGVDIFAIGSDWIGKFDYLNEYCQVVYLERTKGVSSSELRAEKREIRIGLVGESTILNKFERESHFVNGVTITAVSAKDTSDFSDALKELPFTTDYTELLTMCDAVYVISQPHEHYAHIKQALEAGKHVLCESPIAIEIKQFEELTALAHKKGLILMDGIKTAYSTAYDRLIVLAKSGRIGDIVSVDSICTSMFDFERHEDKSKVWNSITAWGPTAMLPIFQLLGAEYVKADITSKLYKPDSDFDVFTKIAFVYPHAVASLKVGVGVKSEGELIISGTKGYIYVPAPWWKTDYFEIRYENPVNNKRYFYQLDGEGIRYEIVSFAKAIQTGKSSNYIDTSVSVAINKLIETFYQKQTVITL